MWPCRTPYALTFYLKGNLGVFLAAEAVVREWREADEFGNPGRLVKTGELLQLTVAGKPAELTEDGLLHTRQGVMSIERRRQTGEPVWEGDPVD